jgi:hypothetical protein
MAACKGGKGPQPDGAQMEAGDMAPSRGVLLQSVCVCEMKRPGHGSRCHYDRCKRPMHNCTHPLRQCAPPLWVYDLIGSRLENDVKIRAPARPRSDGLATVRQ